MLSNPVRAAVLGTLVATGLLGGTAGIAEAQTPAPVESVHTGSLASFSCSTLDALEMALYNLSKATDPDIVDDLLGRVISLLREYPQYPPILPPALQSTYDWLVGKLVSLQYLVAVAPSAQVILTVNKLAAELAKALADEGCTL